MICNPCKAKQPAIPPGPFFVQCEVCYKEAKTTVVGAIICTDCSELANFCEVCKESIENY